MAFPLKKGAVHPSLRILALAADAEGFRGFKFEYRFAPPRRYRFDLAWPGLFVAFEREGGTWQGSRHTTGQGYRDDIRKYNLAASLGWLVCRGTVDMIQDGSALDDLLYVLRAGSLIRLMSSFPNRGRIEE